MMRTTQLTHIVNAQSSLRDPDTAISPQHRYSAARCPQAPPAEALDERQPLSAPSQESNELRAETALQRPLHLDHHQQRQLLMLGGMDITVFFCSTSFQANGEGEESCCQSCCPSWFKEPQQLSSNRLKMLDAALHCIQTDFGKRNIRILLQPLTGTYRNDPTGYNQLNATSEGLCWSKTIAHHCQHHTEWLEHHWKNYQQGVTKQQLLVCLIDGEDVSSCSYAPNKIEQVLQGQVERVEQLRKIFHRHFRQAPPDWLLPVNCIIVVFNPQQQWVRLLEKYYNAFSPYSDPNHLVSWHTRTSFANLEHSLVDAICSAPDLKQRIVRRRTVLECGRSKLD